AARPRCRRPALEHRLPGRDPARDRASRGHPHRRAGADAVAGSERRPTTDLALPADHDPRDRQARIRSVARKAMSDEQTTDPVIKQFREQISDTDRAIVEAINKRLTLVAQVKAYKESRGLGFLDPEREEWMLQ